MLPVRADLGLLDWNTTRSNMVRLLADQGTLAQSMPLEDRPGPALSGIQSSERSALLLSLATTLCRAEYHERRFWRIVEQLAERRTVIGEPLGYDAFVGGAVFEAAAALGAARTLVDQMIHIAARRNGHDKWEVSDAFRGTKAAMDVAEVRCLRAKSQWYDELNKYRNVLHHRGWKGDAGAYFPADAEEPEARNPTRNILLVPDLDSLRRNAGAHAWTYNQRGHLEPVVRRALDGMRELVDAVCLSVWDGKLPKPGTDPLAEHPNAMVAYPRPVPFLDSKAIYLPVFSTEALADAFTGYPAGILAGIVSVPLLKVLFPAPAFALSVAGLEPNVVLGATVTVVVDPSDFTMKVGRLVLPIPAALLASPPFLDPLGLPKEGVGAERLFCWQQGAQ